MNIVNQVPIHFAFIVFDSYKDGMKTLRRFNMGLILYTLFIIVWGAWVRISKSGDGCGEHWPLCHGEWIPSQKPIETWIEFGHRASTGIYGILILIFIYMVFKKASKPAKWASVAVLFFTLTESLIGAQLVLKGLVGADASLARAYWMTIHQVNSMLLTGSLAICYEFLSFNSKSSIFKIKKQLLRVVLLSLAFMLVAGFGALAALSGTLFPTEDLITGIFKDFSADSHIFIRLRVSHPLLACIFGFTMIYITLNTEGNLLLRERSKNLLWLFVVALCVGFATLFLLSPTYLKLSHLAMAHILWMYFLLWVQSFVPKNRITLA